MISPQADGRSCGITYRGGHQNLPLKVHEGLSTVFELSCISECYQSSAISLNVEYVNSGSFLSIKEIKDSSNTCFAACFRLGKHPALCEVGSWRWLRLLLH